MEKYLNKSGKSVVDKYEAGNDFIEVVFTSKETIYTYNHIKPSENHVTIMKEKAKNGEGLCTYISQNVRENYYAKREP